MTQPTAPSGQIVNNQVKLVVWDLDDTFWQGTLSEEPITPIQNNIDLVIALAHRGIVSSICSKNEKSSVESELGRMGVWEYFVLPSISFASKGRSIRNVIDALQLRPENVVLIDDNPSVLAEAAFTCPGIMCLDNPSRLAAQMDCTHLQGSADSDLTRLSHYRLLAARYDSKLNSDEGDEEFLRQSEIRIDIDYEVESHFDRIIELINRSNQLNYTKIRIVTDEDKDAFHQSLDAFGFKAGIVRAWDKYGDYGVVGFFMTLATLREYKLEHFVFSCRIMNMGIEQFVYDFLNRPTIDVVPPVATPIDKYPAVDWIEIGASHEIVSKLRQQRIVLIGGCDMLQLSTYCSSQSVEFTNRDNDGIIKRLDDPFLILDDPELVCASPMRSMIPAFDHADMADLRAAVSNADALILSLYRMMEINYFRGTDGLIVRFDEDAVKSILQGDRALWFVRNFHFVEYSHAERQGLVRASLEWLSENSSEECKIIVLLENIRRLDKYPDEIFHRASYNELITDQASKIEKVQFVDVNQAINERWLFDDGFHMKRQGYHELAAGINELIDGAS
ncbi:MAG: hypothetical protein WC729_29885 [Sphingomonas sp.]|uniref:hypothetical protein n=1 Tax=Sphingomonas sp. TaxID=28214 RepID=UPI00356585EB